MFIIIPLAVILLASSGIGVIVWKKLPYLRKLSPESHEMGSSFWHDMFPEVIDGYHNIPWQEYKEWMLAESEKLVRRIRILFSKIDRGSDYLLRRIKQVQFANGNSNTDGVEATQKEIAPVEPEKTSMAGLSDVHVRLRKTGVDMEALKNSEQQLIVEIAKDPKRIELYERLGDIYTQMKNFQDARESYTTGLKLSPEHEVLTRKLLQTLEEIQGAKHSQS